MTHTGSMSCLNNCSLPGYSPQSCWRGDDFERVLFFTQTDPDGAETAIDLTSFTEWHACIYAKNPSNEIGTLDVALTELVKGKITISLASDSDFFANYPAATYMWQLSAINAEGLRRTYISASPFEVRSNER